MVRLSVLLLLHTGCGSSDACEELADARCECDEAMCDDPEGTEETNDKRTQACKEELEAFTCETE